MCGIVGTTWSKKARQYAFEGLKALEYRGYDSAGIFYENQQSAGLFRTTDRVDGLDKLTPEFKEGIVMGHTRWATHGEVNEINAHPQPSTDSKIYVVHNGVINNYEELKNELEMYDIKFISKTDTEVLANLFMYYRHQKFTFIVALKEVCHRIKGQAAALFIDRSEPGAIGFIKKSSPLLVAKDDKSLYFASDLDPFYGFAEKFAELGDCSYGLARGQELKVYQEGSEVGLSFQNLPDDRNVAKLGRFEHHMLKEIVDEPGMLHKLCKSMQTMALSLELAEYIEHRNIIFIGSGTSYHACLVGSNYFKTDNRTVDVKVASEVLGEPIADNSLYIMVSQSGETYDLIRILKDIKSKPGNRVLAIVNSPVSTIGRQADYALDIKAGKEVAVASTKAYISEVVALYILSRKVLGEEYSNEVDKLCHQLEELASHKSAIEKLAHQFKDTTDSYFIGRRSDRFLAEEMSLKLKEVSYIHSEAVYGGELKHGPIALIDDSFLSFFVLTHGILTENTKSSIAEVKARHGKIIVLSTVGSLGPYPGYAINNDSPLSGLLLVVWIQYFTYYISLALNRNVDKPRNLAKSVTVE